MNKATLLNPEDLSPAANEGIAKPTQGQSMLNLFQDPQTIFNNKDLVEKVATAIKKLPDQERLVISLSYYEGLTLRETGESWQFTEGRIYQIRTRALAARCNFRPPFFTSCSSFTSVAFCTF